MLPRSLVQSINFGARSLNAMLSFSSTTHDWDWLWLAVVCGYIRDLFTVNKSLLLNAVGKIAIGKNQFLSDILKAKYYPNSSFWLAGNHSTKSAFWASITSIKNTLVNNCIIQVHKGNSSIWSMPWCDIWNEIYNHLNLPVTINNLPSRIGDL